MTLVAGYALDRERADDLGVLLARADDLVADCLPGAAGYSTALAKAHR